MSTNNFIHKFFILSFPSIINSNIKIRILHTCIQTYVLVYIETNIVTNVFKKKDFPHHTAHLQN